MYTTEFNSTNEITMTRSQYRTMMREKKRRQTIRKIEYAVAAGLIGFILAFAVYTNVAYYSQPKQIDNKVQYVLTDREHVVSIDYNEEEIKPDHTNMEIGTNMQLVDSTLFASPAVEEKEPEFIEYALPSVYYGDIDFSTFIPYMDYKMVTDTSSNSYQTLNSEKLYIDDNGLCRYSIDDDQFTIDGKDDYVIALGTYYKEKGKTGQRYLIHTTGGYYTAIAGEEKADEHTDEYHMFVRHGENGQYAGMIEFLVDTNYLDSDIRAMGTVTACDDPVLQGEILGIFQIVE